MLDAFTNRLLRLGITRLVDMPHGRPGGDGRGVGLELLLPEPLLLFRVPPHLHPGRGFSCIPRPLYQRNEPGRWRPRRRRRRRRPAAEPGRICRPERRPPRGGNRGFQRRNSPRRARQKRSRAPQHDGHLLDSRLRVWREVSAYTPLNVRTLLIIYRRKVGRS